MKNMLKHLFVTKPNIGYSIARITLGLVIFPHGAQKLLGLFGGIGYAATMNSLTTYMGLPTFVAFLVISIEFFGAIALIFGLGSRIWSLALIVMFVGIIYTTQLENGFFMNWFGDQKGEGYEFSLLVIGIALSVLVNGGGKYSVDALISKNK